MDKLSPSSNSVAGRPKLAKKPFNKTRRIIILLIGILALAIVVGSLVYTYKHAYNKGYKKGEEAGKKASAESSKPIDMFGKLGGRNYRTLTGKIKDIDGDTLTIETNNGITRAVIINSNTKFNRKSETLDKQALVTGAEVTVSTVDEADKIMATRVEIR